MPEPETETVPELTPTERRILALLADGHTPAALPAQLHCTPGQARYALYRVLLPKLGARNRAHALAIAYRTGILP